MFGKIVLEFYRLLVYPNRLERIRDDFRRYRARVKRKNRMRLEREIDQKSIEVHNYPWKLFLDPSPACNLKCRFCPTGTGVSNLEKKRLTPEIFTQIAARLPLRHIQSVSFFTWGEPFLNKDLPSYIKYIKEWEVATDLHTNLSHAEFDDALCDAIVQCGLDELFASIDGASQESYVQYRCGGDFDRVIRNMKRITAAKNRLGSQTPRLYYKMLLTQKNEHEIEEAKKIAEECGAEFYLQEQFEAAESEKSEWIAKSIKEKYGDKRVTSVSLNSPIPTECLHMWTSLFISANGDVLPCCRTFMREHIVGNILTDSFEDIWNGEKMKTLRRYVIDANAPEPSFANPCKTCSSRECTYTAPCS